MTKIMNTNNGSTHHDNELPKINVSWVIAQAQPQLRGDGYSDQKSTSVWCHKYNHSAHPNGYTKGHASCLGCVCP